MKYAEMMKLTVNDLRWVDGLLLTPSGSAISEEETASFLSPQSMATLRRRQHEEFLK